jgi:hypothetical protein
MAIRISAVKTSHLFDDKKEVIIASTGKYTDGLKHDLIRALVKARGLLQPTRASCGVK